MSSAALAVLVGLAELYVGSAVVSRRHRGLAAVWVGITVLLNALILPLSLSGLEAVPLWDILGSRFLQVIWSTGLGLLSTLCVCGCLWADVVREGSGLADKYEAHLLRRISDEEALRRALEAEVSALRAEAERAPSDTPATPTHAGCELCGYWDANQRRVAGHVLQCLVRQRAQARCLTRRPNPRQVHRQLFSKSSSLPGEDSPSPATAGEGFLGFCASGEEARKRASRAVQGRRDPSGQAPLRAAAR